MSGRVAGKVAVITGAARGQGRSHALALAREGADIIALDVCADLPEVELSYPLATEAELSETAEAVRALGRRVVTGIVDVRDLAGLEREISTGVTELGRLDIVCANAGIFSFGASLSGLEAQTWDTVLDINAKGVWLTCRAALPHLLATGDGGSMIITSSVAGLKGTPNVLAYTASKHAAVGVMRTLALELGQHRIRVNSVHPGSVGTPMIFNDGLYKLFFPDRESPTLDDVREFMTRRNVIPEPYIETEDVSNAVLFLASDESRYITATELTIDLGTSAL